MATVKDIARSAHHRLKQLPVYERAYTGMFYGSNGGSEATSGAKPSARQLKAAGKKSGEAVLKALSGSGEYRALSSTAMSLLPGATDEMARVYWKYAIEAEMSCGNHEQAQALADEMIFEHGHGHGHYHKALSYFLTGDYEAALSEAQVMAFVSPGSTDNAYLIADIFEAMGEREDAWRTLEGLLYKSKRIKTWLQMANLVQDDADLRRLLGNRGAWRDGVGSRYHKDASEYVALGALRVRNMELAKHIWRDSIFSASRSKAGFQTWQVRDVSYSAKRAEDALIDLNTFFNDAAMEMFLVSGTLLGCVRENKLLGHDKDIDVGVWSDIDRDKFSDLVASDGRFSMLKSRSPEIVRLRHVNGINIDIFYHFRDDDDYWHAGIKMKWSNTPFTLEKREFLGEEFLIPTDYDLYLTENYGDWRTPKIAFDSAFDTPNGTVLDDDEMLIHSFKGVMNSMISQNWEKVAFYLDFLEKNGEEPFVGRFLDRLDEMEIKQVRKARKAAEKALKKANRAADSQDSPDLLNSSDELDSQVAAATNA